MHHANHFYGHAHVLAQYCGLNRKHPPRIEGYLQHGWNVVDGLGAISTYVPGKPIFVWSEQTRRRAWSMGRRHATVVGAPFLYLMSFADRRPVERKGTIWYPFHGWERQTVNGDHRRLIDEIVDTEPGPITFCLYWNEYRDERIRAEYARAGRVICHGYRGLEWKDTDIRFLHKQLAELRRHERVASNRLSSAVMYGAAAGCAPAVYGDPMHLDHEHGPTADRIRRQWPELHGVNPDPLPAQASARYELGEGYLASPGELRAILGWPANVRTSRFRSAA